MTAPLVPGAIATGVGAGLLMGVPGTSVAGMRTSKVQLAAHPSPPCGAQFPQRPPNRQSASVLQALPDAMPRQTGAPWQVASEVHGSPALSPPTQFPPSSHCSLPSITPLPQVAGCGVAVWVGVLVGPGGLVSVGVSGTVGVSAGVLVGPAGVLVTVAVAVFVGDGPAMVGVAVSWMQTDGVPEHCHPDSTWQPASQPSPLVRLPPPWSQVSWLVSIMPLPQVLGRHRARIASPSIVPDDV